MKKWLSLLLMVSMVMLLAACGGSNDYEEPEEYVEDEEVIEEDELDEPVTAASGIDVLRSEVEPDDGMWYLLRDDETYSLGRTVHMVDGVDYSSAGASFPGENDLQVYQIGRMQTPLDLTGFCSYGDVPVPVLGENDLVVSYSSSSVPTLGLHSVSYSGDAICLEYDDNLGTLKFYDAENREACFETGADSADVTDENGDSVIDWCDLDRDEYYTVSWYEGTQYNECSMRAECKFYDDGESDVSVALRLDPEYEIEGERTKNGYAVYDLSEIPAGTYFLMDAETFIYGGLIEIK